MAREASKSFTAASLAERLGGRVTGRADAAVRGVQSIAAATEGHITFAVDHRRLEEWATSRAAVVVASNGAGDVEFDLARRAIIRVDDAEQAVITLLHLFGDLEGAREPGVHPTAVIAPGARLGRDVCIGPHVVIGDGGVIGERVALDAGVVLERGVTIGDDSVLHSNVVIRRGCTIGRRVILHSGVAIGTDGFNYRPSPDRARLLKVPHLGAVEIGDDVEIGANSCVDRGKFGSTVVGSGTKIDNLVQIGHNVRVGRNCVIAAQAALAGSVTIGDWVQVGGQAGVADHLTVGDGARLAGGAGVARSVEPGGEVFGLPAIPAREAFRQATLLGRLREWMRDTARRLDALERWSQQP